MTSSTLVRGEPPSLSATPFWRELHGRDHITVTTSRQTLNPEAQLNTGSLTLRIRNGWQLHEIIIKLLVITRRLLENTKNY